MIANVAPEPSEQVDRGIKKLMSELQKTGNEKAIVLQIKELVPEFISNNSPFPTRSIRDG